MKLYKKEIRPYIQPPQLQGFNDRAFPVEGYDWVSEDLEDKLRAEIDVKDPWSKLFFRVRYVSVSEFDQGESSGTLLDYMFKHGLGTPVPYFKEEQIK